ncbi:MAG: tRNA (adenosine(37)-N6)-threonylcarbamoyltransferase complex ATPase subunit type 1 TsaE [Deltaproteobacteria bacterium]|nr:MAG: tRNA (adenosine(37)-N6)-threonylcarbamoyltransferase complex ATPase subunit type 1 TsaE [Deltaproteobacteria bacterium]
MSEEFEFTSPHRDATVALGRLLGRMAAPGDWIGLSGELGAGKTTLVQGIAKGAGVPDSVPVTSPTFVIVQQYRGRLPIYHIDLYRLEGGEQLEELGYQELAEGDGICVVEWFDLIPEARPCEGLFVYLELIDEDARKVRIQAEGERAVALLDEVRRQSRELGLV